MSHDAIEPSSELPIEEYAEKATQLPDHVRVKHRQPVTLAPLTDLLRDGRVHESPELGAALGAQINSVFWQSYFENEVEGELTLRKLLELVRRELDATSKALFYAHAIVKQQRAELVIRYRKNIDALPGKVAQGGVASCNLHNDCSVAEAEAIAQGMAPLSDVGPQRLYHCRTDECPICENMSIQFSTVMERELKFMMLHGVDYAG